MLLTPPPLSNAERQRRFQRRHPGYDRRRKAAKRAAEKRTIARLRAAAQAAAAGARVAEAKAAETMAAEARPQPLMLPAPVGNPLLAELNALAASLARRSAPEPLPLPERVSVESGSSRAA
jgi:hypothetical protein